MSPKIVPKGRSLPPATPAAKIAGSTGKMQGERAVKKPAKKEKINKGTIIDKPTCYFLKVGEHLFICKIFNHVEKEWKEQSKKKFHWTYFLNTVSSLSGFITEASRVNLRIFELNLRETSKP